MPPRSRTRIIGHRGASAVAPENTLAAFRLARDLGADGFELDCTLSADGEVMVIHDDTLDRTTDGHGRVADHTVAQLRALSAGSWKSPVYAIEHVPTLTEALALTAATFEVLIEAKAGSRDDALVDDLRVAAGEAELGARRDAVGRRLARASHADITLARAIARTVDASAASRSATIMSFSIIAIATVACESPHLRAMLLTAADRDAPTDEPAWANANWWVNALDLRGLGAHHPMLTSPRITALHNQGRIANAWTVNEHDDVLQLGRAGADYITTDVPDIAIGALNRTADLR